jgi:hypothetical protein
MLFGPPLGGGEVSAPLPRPVRGGTGHARCPTASDLAPVGFSGAWALGTGASKVAAHWQIVYGQLTQRYPFPIFTYCVQQTGVYSGGPTGA